MYKCRVEKPSQIKKGPRRNLENLSTAGPAIISLPDELACLLAGCRLWQRRAVYRSLDCLITISSRSSNGRAIDIDRRPALEIKSRRCGEWTLSYTERERVRSLSDLYVPINISRILFLRLLFSFTCPSANGVVTGGAAGILMTAVLMGSYAFGVNFYSLAWVCRAFQRIIPKVSLFLLLADGCQNKAGLFVNNDWARPSYITTIRPLCVCKTMGGPGGYKYLYISHGNK